MNPEWNVYSVKLMTKWSIIAKCESQVRKVRSKGDWILSDEIFFSNYYALKEWEETQINYRFKLLYNIHENFKVNHKIGIYLQQIKS